MSADIKAMEELGRFADYSDEDLARQCRFQARSETLDPDYEKFMRAVALRLDALASAIAERDEARAERDEATNWTDIVERHGTDNFDALADAWLAQEAIQRVTNAATSTFAKWANDDLMSRFRKQQLSMFHMAYVEGCLSGVRAEKVLTEAAEARLEELTRERDDALKDAAAMRAKANTRKVEDEIRNLATRTAVRINFVFPEGNPQAFEAAIKENEESILNTFLILASEYVNRSEALATRLEEAKAVLGRIERWFGEFPATGKFWPNPDGSPSDRPISYAAEYGSNGERDFMRGLARAFLHQGGEDAR